MFRVATVVSRSTIHGFGVFAAAAIPRGTIVWEFDEGADWTLSEQELAASRFRSGFASRWKRGHIRARTVGTSSARTGPSS